MSGPSWGVPPWRVELPPGRAALPERCDVAVVGAGLTGLAAAYTLARQGVDVVVFEAGRLGAGASGRSGGIVLEGTSAGPLPEADDCIATLERTLSEAAIACELELPGCWELTHAENGAPLWRDGERALSLSETVPGGTLDPGKLLGGLAAAAVREHAELHEQAPVRGISGGAPLVLQIRDRELRADRVVLALNAYTASLISAGEDFHPALTLALSTQPLAPGTLEAIGLGARNPFYTVDGPYLWGRPWGHDRLIFGGGLAFDGAKRVERLDIRAQEIARSLAQLEQRVRGLHPALADMRIAERWGGPVAFRASRTPILCQHPSLDGLILIAAYAGHGVALSVHLGRLAARTILAGGTLPRWGEVVSSSEAREIG